MPLISLSEPQDTSCSLLQEPYVYVCYRYLCTMYVCTYIPKVYMYILLPLSPQLAGSISVLLLKDHDTFVCIN